MTWLSSSGRGVSFGGFSGKRSAVDERRVLNNPKGLLEADFDQIPVSIILDIIV